MPEPFPTQQVLPFSGTPSAPPHVPQARKTLLSWQNLQRPCCGLCSAGSRTRLIQQRFRVRSQFRKITGLLVSFQRGEVATARGLAWCPLTSASELPSHTTAPHQRPWQVPIRLTDLCQKCPSRKSWASLSFLVKRMVNLLNKVSIFNDYDLMR